MKRELRNGMIAGALAPFVFLLSVVGIAWIEEDFMERLGWGEVPSGLSLGPDGWLQIVNFIVLGVLLIAFALGVRAVPARTQMGVRIAPVLLALAGMAAVMLAFKVDPQNSDATWHGDIHLAAYLTLLVSLVISYPFTWWRVRGTSFWRSARWPSVLALLLFPPVLLLPDSGSAGNYLFIAVALAPLAAIAIRMAVGVIRADPASDD